jgi:hypothetical protein
MNNIRRHLGQVLLLSVWVLLLGGGFWTLFVYSNTPGESAQAPQQYPADTRLDRDPNLPTLLIFGHPQCPCSKASVGELERLMPHLKGKVRTYVVFVKPKSQTENWAKEDLWKKAQSIPDVRTVLDEGGVEAGRFGAKTSGQTFLYDKIGNLVFRGGITASRGHMGDNLGRDSILAFIETGKTTIATTSVFGCSLVNPERAPAAMEHHKGHHEFK